MLPTRSTVTVQPASLHHVTKRSRISLFASVRATRRRPPALPGPIAPERMTVDQKRGGSMTRRASVDMGRILPARSGLTPPREKLSTSRGARTLRGASRATQEGEDGGGARGRCHTGNDVDHRAALQNDEGRRTLAPRRHPWPRSGSALLCSSRCPFPLLPCPVPRPRPRAP